MLYLIFFISIFLHEMCHVIVGKLFGVEIKKLKFFGVGFCLEFYEKNEMNFFRKFLVIIIGPLFNFIIFITYINKFKVISYFNLGLAILNFLPIHPLDGGQLLYLILEYKFGYSKAMIISELIGSIILILLTFVYAIFIIEIKNISILMVLGYLWCINLKRYEKICLLKRIDKLIEKSDF